MEDFVFFIRKKDPRVLIFHEKAFVMESVEVQALYQI